MHKIMRSGLWILLLAALSSAGDLPKELRVGGFYIGPQAYSFRMFSFYEAVDKAKQVGAGIIEAYPEQKLSPADPTPFNHDAPPSVWAKAKLKLEAAGVRLVNYGVVRISNKEAEARKVFDFAKIMGIPCITSEPSPDTAETFDLIEKLVKEYDIQVAIHNHPKKADNPGYRFWDPNFVLQMIKNRDRRIGSGADTGHWIRSGVKPLDALRILDGRLVSSHLKDMNEFSPKATDVVYGTGVADIKSILDEFKRQGFTGNISIEYESNWENNVAEISDCISFVREYGVINP